MIACVAVCTPHGARRYAVWLSVSVKFALPTILLAGAGAKLAAAWPLNQSTFAAWLAHRVNALLEALDWAGMDLDSPLGWAWGFVWLIGFFLVLVRWRRELRRAEYLSTVALVGVLRPKIVFPARLWERVTRDELQAVLAHELAHVRRRDNLAAIFTRVVRCAFWFHPLLWLAEAQLQCERECACDDDAIGSGVDQTIYLSTLWKVCQMQFGLETAGVSAMGSSNLRLQLARLQRPPAHSKCSLAPGLLACGLLFSAAAVPVASGYCEACVSHGDSTERSSR